MSEGSRGSSSWVWCSFSRACRRPRRAPSTWRVGLSSEAAQKLKGHKASKPGDFESAKLIGRTRFQNGIISAAYLRPMDGQSRCGGLGIAPSRAIVISAPRFVQGPRKWLSLLPIPWNLNYWYQTHKPCVNEERGVHHLFTHLVVAGTETVVRTTLFFCIHTDFATVHRHLYLR